MRLQSIIPHIFLLTLLLTSATHAQSLRDGISEGQTRRIGTSELRLVVVSDRSARAVFAWNSEMSTSLEENEQHTFSDGTRISVTDIIDDEAGDGNDYVEYFLLPSANIATDDPEYDLCPILDPDACPETDEEQAIRETQEAEQQANLSTAIGNECTKATDCSDKNPCTTENCVVGLCQVSKPSGCGDGTTCLPYGMQIFKSNIQFYCDTTSTLLETRNAGATCKLNYQCTSRSCKNNVCQTSSIATPGVILPQQSPSTETQTPTTPSTESSETPQSEPIIESPKPVPPKSTWQIIKDFFKTIWNSIIR